MYSSVGFVSYYFEIVNFDKVLDIRLQVAMALFQAKKTHAG